MRASESLGGKVPRLYRVYGVTVASRFPFVSPLPAAHRRPDVTFTLAEASPLGDLRDGIERLFADPAADDYAVPNYVERIGQWDIIRYSGTADFYVGEDRIVCCLHDPARYHAVELLFLGTVLAWWLERTQRIAMHMSAVVCGNRALAFMSNQGGGKSSLAAALANVGCPLLADDLVAVEHHESCFIAHPGYPQMRLWPDEADHFVGDHERFEVAHPNYTKRRVPVAPDGIGTFCGEERQLGCIYVPERRAPGDPRSDIEIRPLSPRDAFAALVGGAFAPRLADVRVRRGDRLERLAALVCQVPICRLVYPDGLHVLPLVAEAVLDDFSKVALFGLRQENV